MRYSDDRCVKLNDYNTMLPREFRDTRRKEKIILLMKKNFDVLRLVLIVWQNRKDVIARREMKILQRSLRQIRPEITKWRQILCNFIQKETRQTFAPNISL